MALKLGVKLPPKPVEIPVEEVQKPAPKSGSELAEVMAQIQKDKGKGVVVYANKIPPVRRLPTGNFEFDYQTGGGFPCGRYSIVYGPSSSNKTNVVLKAIAQAQRLPPPCNKAVFVNVEQTFDPVWAAKNGVDVKKLIVVNGGYGEETCDLIDALVRAEDVALLAVDSVAALVSSKEIEQSMEKFDVGTSALLVKRLVNKLMYAFAEERKRDHDPCVILINQTRFKVGVLFGDPETFPGGEAQRFLSSLTVRFFSPAKQEIEKDINPDLPAFKKTMCVVKKSKIPIRRITSTFDLCVLENNDLKIGDTDSFKMVSDMLKAQGLIAKKPKGYEVEGMLFPTMGAMQDQYRKDWEFQLMLQQLVIASTSTPMIIVDDPEEKMPPGKPGIAIPAAPVQSIAVDVKGG